MADAADRASEVEQLLIDAALSTRPSPKLVLGCGRCLHCDEPIDPPRRWCDAGCRDDYEKAQRAEQQRPA